VETVEAPARAMVLQQAIAYLQLEQLAMLRGLVAQQTPIVARLIVTYLSLLPFVPTGV
jgi:hypothetical protein